MLRHEVRPQPDGVCLALGGAIRRDRVPELCALLARHRPKAGQRLTLDLSDVEALDSAAVAALVRGWRDAKAQQGTLTLGPASDAATRALSMFRVGEQQPEPPRPPNLLEGLGQGVLDSKDAARDFLQLAADTTFVGLTALVRPKLLRLPALAEQCIYVGSQALPIVGLISLLIGLTLAFQSAYQLQQFGAAIYVAKLTAVAMVREMGPLMTAILVAGRSGSSIAAEIATMKVSEELDALQTMGLDPVSFLALPRLLAVVLMMPLLTILADLMGILGGFAVGIFYLDISFTAYLNNTIDSLTAGDVMSGLVKSLSFGWGIALIGLFYGFRVRGGAGEVGRVTTASVVASIFYIVVAGCLFSVLFYVIL